MASNNNGDRAGEELIRFDSTPKAVMRGHRLHMWRGMGAGGGSPPEASAGGGKGRR